MNRKTPIRHKVKSHKRKGRNVRSYSRGKGRRRSTVIVKRRILSNEEIMARARADMESRYPEGFRVTFFYANKKHPSETVHVVVKDLDFPKDDPTNEAVAAALKIRKYKYKAIQTMVTDPAFGKILGKIGSGFKSGVKRIGGKIKSGIKKVAPRVKHVAKTAVGGAKGIAQSVTTIPGAPAGGGVVVYQEPSAIASVPTTQIVRESRQLQASEEVEIRNLTTDAFERPGLPLKYKALAEAKLATEYPEAYQAIKRRYSEEGR